jgi:hypothetical protein
VEGKKGEEVGMRKGDIPHGPRNRVKKKNKIKRINSSFNRAEPQAMVYDDAGSDLAVDFGERKNKIKSGIHG